MSDADVRFYFDPVCPFAWMTSKWVRMVAAQRDYAVDWRFMSLRMINSEIDYDSHFPAGYEEGHTSGLRLLRVAARARAEHGRSAVGRFYEIVSGEIFDSPGAAALTPATCGSRAFAGPLLARAGLPADLADALDDTRWDDEIRAEGDEALILTGHPKRRQVKRQARRCPWQRGRATFPSRPAASVSSPPSQVPGPWRTRRRWP